MRHQNAGRKFSRTAAHRRALFRNLATTLILNEQVRTTVEKAKDLRRVVEPLVALGKVDSLASRRKAHSYLLDEKAVWKLFKEIGPRFAKRAGGYTRVIKGENRSGDAAKMAYISFVEAEVAKKGRKTKSTKAAAAKASPSSEAAA